MIDDPFDDVPARRPRVVILFNEPVLPQDHPDADSEHEILYTVDAVQRRSPRRATTWNAWASAATRTCSRPGCAELRPDVVFNLFEGLADFGSTEAHVAGLLEWLGVPFTGSPYQTLCLARSKHLDQAPAARGRPADAGVLRRRGVAGAALSARMAGHRQARDWRTPASASTRAASSPTQHDLDERIAYLLETYGPPVLVEQFIRGREFNVAVIESAGPARVAAFGDPLHGRRPRLLADRHLRRQVEARLARLRVHAAALPGRR